MFLQTLAVSTIHRRDQAQNHTAMWRPGPLGAPKIPQQEAGEAVRVTRKSRPLFSDTPALCQEEGRQDRVETSISSFFPSQVRL